MSDTPSFATCDLCDAHKGDDSGAFRVLPPVFREFGAKPRFAGPVVTVKCFEDNTPVKRALEGPGEGRVLVVDGGGSLRRALASMPLPTERKADGQTGVVVQIQGVWVRPGDWLYADEDGIVVSATPLHG